jgi:hypothetical protein
MERQCTRCVFPSGQGANPLDLLLANPPFPAVVPVVVIVVVANARADLP